MISNVFIQSLMNNRSFARKVLPHIKSEYFEDLEHKTLFEYIKQYIIDYKNLPTNNTIKIELNKDEKLSSTLFENIIKIVDDVYVEKNEYSNEWLIDNCEQWCKDRAIYNAIVQSVEFIEDKKNINQIPDLVRKALQVEFDSQIGIEYFDDKGIDKRFLDYNKKIKKYASGIEMLDNIFGGGFEPKSLTVFVSGTNVGKTNALISFTSNFLRNNHDVLYITLEMAEEKIAQRIDANFLDVDINDVPLMKQKNFKKNLLEIKNKTKGRLVIKEYPPASINSTNIMHLLDELKLKLEFVPKIIVLDYLNLMNSTRIKSDNMYSIVKSIVEEIRGIAVEGKYCVITATQGTRETMSETNSDMDLTNISESAGVPQTADAVIAGIMPQELRDKNVQIWKILKNRFGGTVGFKFPVSVNFARASVKDIADNEAAGLKISGNSTSEKIKLETEKNRQKKKKVIFADRETKTDNDPSEELLALLE